MVTTHSEDEWRLLRSLRNQGRADSGGWLEHARLGFNYRIDDIRAAIGLGQLERLDEILARRAPSPHRYAELSGRHRGAGASRAPDDDEHERSWFVYVVALPVGADREAVIECARRPRRPDSPLPAVHPPPVVHAGAIRLSRGALPGRGGRELAHARASVSRAARRGRSGSTWPRRFGRHSGLRTRPEPGRSTGRVGALGRRHSGGRSITYSRLDATELYNVSHEGLAGGLEPGSGARSTSRLRSLPSALALLAVAALPRKAWLVAGPAIALCAIVPVAVDQDDLNARWINAFPALGVVLALCADDRGRTASPATSFAPRRAGDRLEVVVAAVVLVLSLPWIAAELGFHLPGDVFLGEELYTEKDGRTVRSRPPRPPPRRRRRRARSHRACSCPAFGLPTRDPAAGGHGLSRSACSPTARSTSRRTCGTSRSSSAAGPTPTSRRRSFPGHGRSGSSSSSWRCSPRCVLLREDEAAAPVRARA